MDVKTVFCCGFSGATPDRGGRGATGSRRRPSANLPLRLVFAGLLALFAWTAPGVAAARSCIGDCDGDGTITVDEIVILVNIAIGNAPVQACPGIGETVEIDTIVAAVGDALQGCDAAPGITVGTVSVAAGAVGDLPVSLDAAFSQSVYGTQNSLAIPPELELAGECRPATGDLAGVFTKFSGPECPTSECVRAMIVSRGGRASPIPAGQPLYVCAVRVAAGTQPGRLPVSCAETTTVGVIVEGIPRGLAAICRGGAVTVTP